MKYTKYNWKIEYPILGDFIIHADGLKIASAHLINYNLEEQEANAKLISCAPELLENLIRCVDRLEENGFGDINAVTRAKKAIKKATII